MAELLRAGERGDLAWAQSIPGCFILGKPTAIRRIDCTGRLCQVRVMDGGAVVWTLRRYLYQD